jgi:hypothetical protein
MGGGGCRGGVGVGVVSLEQQRKENEGCSIVLLNSPRSRMEISIKSNRSMRFSMADLSVMETLAEN